MIHVEPAPEPADFASRVTDPGLRAIAEMVGERPRRAVGKRFAKIAARREEIPADRFPPFWREALDDLREAYDHICAYSCFRIHEVTGAGSVDHFAPKSRSWDQVYRWTNYRLACARLNARKRDFSDVLDPFEVQDDWFQLELVAFQIVPNPELDGLLQQTIQDTVARLNLNDFAFRRSRGEDCQAYLSGDVSLRRLERESPFVARELRRQGRLRAPDV